MEMILKVLCRRKCINHNKRALCSYKVNRYKVIKCLKDREESKYNLKVITFKYERGNEK